MHLYLRNIGPLSEVDLDLPRALVLIGPQASGKSTLAKVIFLFERLIVNYFRDDVFERIQNSQLYQPFPDKFYFQKIKATFEDFFGPHEEYGTDFQAIFTYPSGAKAIFESNQEGYLTFRLEGLQGAEWLQDIMYKNRSKEEKYKLENSQDIDILNQKCYSFFGISLDPYYLPTNKEVYNELKGILTPAYTKNWNEPDDYQEPHLTSNIIPKRFYRFLNKELKNLLKNRALRNVLIDVPRAESPARHDLAGLAGQILKAELSVDQGVFSLTFPRVADHSPLTIPIIRGSSGQQEAFSILLAAALMLIKPGAKSLTVEEPEAGLFPEGQEKLVRALALAFNANPDNRVTLTTHSPYILTALDNLVQAHEIAQTSPENRAKVAAVIPETMWIPFDQLGVYLVQDGVLTSIKDMEARSVGGQAIDSVSDTIGDTYNQLLHIRYGED